MDLNFFGNGSHLYLFSTDAVDRRRRVVDGGAGPPPSVPRDLSSRSALTAVESGQAAVVGRVEGTLLRAGALKDGRWDGEGERQPRRDGLRGDKRPLTDYFVLLLFDVGLGLAQDPF